MPPTGAFFYIDPPYLQQTRPQSGASYGHEFGEGDHAAPLERLRGIKGRAAVSGYRSDLYDQALADWRRVDDRAKGLTAGDLGAK